MVFVFASVFAVFVVFKYTLCPQSPRGYAVPSCGGGGASALERHIEDFPVGLGKGLGVSGISLTK